MFSAFLRKSDICSEIGLITGADGFGSGFGSTEVVVVVVLGDEDVVVPEEGVLVEDGGEEVLEVDFDGSVTVLVFAGSVDRVLVASVATLTLLST